MEARFTTTIQQRCEIALNNYSNTSDKSIIPSAKTCSKNDDVDYLRYLALSIEDARGKKRIIQINWSSDWIIRLKRGKIYDLKNIRDLVYSHCKKYKIDYVSEDNVNNLTRAIIKQVNIDVLPDDKSSEEQKITITTQEKETKKETKVRLLAEALERKYHFAGIEDTEELFYYNPKKGIYVPAEALVKAQLEKIQPGVITDTVNNVIHKLARRHLYKREMCDADENIINMQNGLYDIAAGKLRKHTYSYLSRSQIPVKYDKNARCKRFGKFLGEVVYPEQVRTVVELMAYTFLRDNPFELYVILLGVGANGKSVLMHVLTKLHGQENVSPVPLATLLNNRFAKKELEGKNVNIDMEMSKATINDMGVLKELTGQQPVRIEPKHLPAYSTRLWAKLFFSTNEMPEMMDFSDGHYRREVVISFPYQFEEVSTKQEKAEIVAAMKAGSNRRIADPTLKDVLTTPEELSGIFNAIMIPLRNRIMKNKPVYMDAKTIEDRRHKHELISDPIRAFFNDAIEPDVEGTVTKERLYEAYRKFCRFQRLPIESYDQFCKLVKKKFPHEIAEGRDSSKDRKTIWKGISLIKWSNPDPLQEVLTS